MVYAFDCDYSFHTPTEDTRHPSAIRSIFSDCDNAVRLPFNAIYRVSLIALTNAPSSNTLQNLMILPFGSESSTMWMNGRLASPSCKAANLVQVKNIGILCYAVHIVHIWDNHYILW